MTLNSEYGSDDSTLSLDLGMTCYDVIVLIKAALQHYVLIVLFSQEYLHSVNVMIFVIFRESKFSGAQAMRTFKSEKFDVD